MPTELRRSRPRLKYSFLGYDDRRTEEKGAKRCTRLVFSGSARSLAAVWSKVRGAAHYEFVSIRRPRKNCTPSALRAFGTEKCFAKEVVGAAPPSPTHTSPPSKVVLRGTIQRIKGDIAYCLFADLEGNQFIGTCELKDLGSVRRDIGALFEVRSGRIAGSHYLRFVPFHGGDPRQDPKWLSENSRRADRFEDLEKRLERD